MRKQFTNGLVESLISSDKVSLIRSVSEIMPQGRPDFEAVRFAPAIVNLVAEHGPAKVHAVLVMMIRDYCSSINVPESKKMNGDQEMEAASFLLDECGDFRMEDYLMMFTLAKRGKIGKVFDRVDIQLLSDFKESYSALRTNHAFAKQEEEVRRKEEGADYGPHPLTEKQREGWRKVLDRFRELSAEGQRDREKNNERLKEMEEQRRKDNIARFKASIKWDTSCPGKKTETIQNENHE